MLAVWVLWGIWGGMLVLGVYATVDRIIVSLRYKPGRNRFHRICKKCGAHQVVYESCLGVWWEEVYPLGNDPDCGCHKDVQARDI